VRGGREMQICHGYGTKIEREKKEKEVNTHYYKIGL
jgi:hypothetical protein